jgi:hypothetical protein
MSQNPKIASFVFPADEIYISPVFIMFLPIIYAPACPNTSASSEVVLKIAFSIIDSSNL